MSNIKTEQTEPSQKRERVLKAALECFTLYGFKRTAMDDIAQKAAISRAALYLLFQNKEDIFRTLSERLHSEALTRAEIALQTEGALAQRLLAAFEGKDLELLEIVNGSPHGAELVNLNHEIGVCVFEDAEVRFKELLAQTISQAESCGEIALSRVGLDASECAELLILCTHGLKKAPSSLLYRQRLAHLFWVFSTAVSVVNI